MKLESCSSGYRNDTSPRASLADPGLAGAPHTPYVIDNAVAGALRPPSTVERPGKGVLAIAPRIIVFEGGR